MIATKDTDSGSRSTALTAQLPTQRTCDHTPPCPDFQAPDREAAHLVASHPEQGWGLLCNGVVLFDDTGELLPDGRVVAPHRRRD